MIRRWTIGLLTLLLTLSVIGWISYIPLPALETLRSVPAHAQIIYQSKQPTRSVLENLPVFKGWKTPALFFQTLENSPLTVASVPLGGRGRRDTWVVVSAPGLRTLGLRWKLMIFPPAGVKAIRSYGAWPIWEYNDPALPLWMRIRFTIAEGLLVCSISDDSHDLYYLMDTLDGRRPSAERKETR